MAQKGRYIVLILSLILLIVNLMIIDFEEFEWKDTFGPISNVLLMAAMIISIKHSKKK